MEKQNKSDRMWGISEVRGKSQEQVLKIIIERQALLDSLYEHLAVDSGFREELFNDIYMKNDFWLYTITEILDWSIIPNEESTRIAQGLMDVFNVNNRTTVEEHRYLMENNNSYYRYFMHMFSCKDRDSCMFWKYVATMGGADEKMESARRVIGVPSVRLFAEEYIKFISQMEIYLSMIFPKCGLKDRAKKIGLSKLECIVDALGREIDVDRDLKDFYNPIYEADIIYE